MRKLAQTTTKAILNIAQTNDYSPTNDSSQTIEYWITGS